MSENEDRKDEVTETEPTEPTLDELKAKLEKLEAENAKLKSAQSNASADASKWKKQLQERMTEQERAAAETKDLIERLQSENEKLTRELGDCQVYTECFEITDGEKRHAFCESNVNFLLNCFKNDIDTLDHCLVVGNVRLAVFPL